MIRPPIPSFHDSPHYARWTERRWGDEQALVRELTAGLQIPPETRAEARGLAQDLITALREQGQPSRLEALIHEYDLTSEEGVALMTLAEALLRIPDEDTVDLLIEERIGSGLWQEHVGHSDSLFVNASTWGLLLTGRVLQLDDGHHLLARLLHQGGKPLLREAVRRAMSLIGAQFVVAEDINAALTHADHNAPACYSFDMLGEAAMTAQDATRFTETYANAIAAIGDHDTGAKDARFRHSVSIKLSALHPRFEYAQSATMLAELTARVLDLATAAKEANLLLTLDAEESERIEPMLDLFQRVYTDPALDGWDGFGLALQSYQKSAVDMLDWLQELSSRHGRRIPVRLVKGAYWDREIKRAQQLGLRAYPVFTRKSHTDLNFLVCAQRLLAAPACFYPQFGTHNALTVATLLTLETGQPIEFQRLYGMGESLCDLIRQEGPHDPLCRIYAPVGNQSELLPYLIRRLLENGAASSFVNRLVDHDYPLASLLTDPQDRVAQHQGAPLPEIPLPRYVFGDLRDNSAAPDLADASDLTRLGHDMAQQYPAYDSPPPTTTSDAALVQMLEDMDASQPDWNRLPVTERAEILENAADFIEQEMPGLVALLAREAGKTLIDGVAEVREAADFCRYYAGQAQRLAAQDLPAIAGERNRLEHLGRGIFLCISPWNFPLAIFTGQVAAALVCGNAVIAKPASQTPGAAAAAVTLLHEAGVPAGILRPVFGPGAELGQRLLTDPRLAGVAFTGSVATAHAINRTLADRAGPILPFIAETGGQNAMIVDSTALPEQVVRDVLDSSFRSAGQRCSALRVLYLQQEIADHVLELLVGAMAELRLGDPLDPATDVGPVIDHTAAAALDRHATRMAQEGRLLYRCSGPEHGDWPFCPPQVYEIDHIDRIGGEVFGPILHVIRFAADELDAVVEQINGTGFGLTAGVHSRLQSRAAYLARRVRVGNSYINRNMIGAVVGSQPFGGHGMSGTGPKAGGPNYLFRFCNEHTLSINTMATGGDPALLSLGE